MKLDQYLLKDELHHVQGVLRCNGYPKGFVWKYKVQLRQEKEKNDDDENEPQSTVKIPYIKGLRLIRRILGGHKSEQCSKLMIETLGRILMKVKDLTPPEERPGIVYKITAVSRVSANNLISARMGAYLGYKLYMILHYPLKCSTWMLNREWELAQAHYGKCICGDVKLEEV